MNNSKTTVLTDADMKSHPNQIWEQASTLICQDFDVDLPMQFEQENRYAQLKIWLSGIIQEKIKYDLEGLLNLLYRLDIAEKKALAALNNQTEEPVDCALADLIIKREIQKVQTRAWYRQRQRTFSANSNNTTSKTEEDVELW